MSIDKQTQLLKDGYCLFENVLDKDILTRLQAIATKMISAQSDEHFEAQRSTGSMISVHDEPNLAELVAYPSAIAALKSLGYNAPKWRSGYIISKPPQSPPLFWHQDWWGWADESSYNNPHPQQLFLMYYLIDTSLDNGCLRVIPGSHIKRHSVHDETPEAHTDDLRRAANLNHPAFKLAEGEVDIPVKAGDLVIGDSRLLHAAWANNSNDYRTVITLWYHPDFSNLSEALQASIIERQRSLAGWSDESRRLLEPLLPLYEGDTKPVTWMRVPTHQLT